MTASDIAAALLRSHTDYGGDTASSFVLSAAPPESPRYTVSEWLAQVRELYQPDAVPLLVGRQVVLGVALLDTNLWIDLQRDDFADRLASETYGITSGKRFGWEAILSPAGAERLDLMRASRDNVRFLSDRPALTDLLERKPLAEALAIRLRRIWSQDVRPQSPKSVGSAYLVNLYGPWGAGKTSILNFLSDALTSPGDPGPVQMRAIPDAAAQKPWVVVKLNAWQHQRLGMPWWWLMNEVYKRGWRQVVRRDPLAGIYLMVREYTWRLSVRRLPELLTVALVLGILWLAFSFGLFQRVLEAPLASTGAAADSLSKIIAVSIGIVTTAYGFTRLLELQSARSAKQFIDNARDPMGAISDHFIKLTRWMGRPVAVFIDDVDRCQQEFVLELLEGIQTLFIDAPVVYVVAADRRWLRGCYETAYANFANTVEVTGRPLGYHFLEKIFQLSVPVPQMSSPMRDSFLKSLVAREAPADTRPIKQIQVEMRAKASELKSDSQIDDASQRANTNSIEDRVFRGELARRLAQDELEIGTKHKLLQFGPLTEPNPRAIKSLVNSYGVLKTIAILSGVHIGMELALWTIVWMRWPVLAEYLAARPEDAKCLRSKDVPASLRSHADHALLRAQFRDPEVVSVFNGGNTGFTLDVTKVRLCASLVPDAPAAKVAVT